jgi:ribosome-binding protein aMBF1 (putative translation factor)
LTQEELAKKVSENVAFIRDLEKGEGVYKPKIVEKIEKVLNVKFERSWKK